MERAFGPAEKFAGTSVATQAETAPWLSDRQCLFLLGLVWTALWSVTLPVGEFPLNDDWIYALAARSIVENGRYSMPMPALPNLIAQAYWGALFCLPFGFSFMALRLSTGVLGAVGVLAMYLLLRELGARRSVSLIGALGLAVNPLYLELSTTFMTDVPFTSLSIVSLWLYVRGARRDSLSTIVAAFVMAFATLMVRQFGLLLLVAFGAAQVMRRGTGLRSLAVAGLPAVLGGFLQVAFGYWLLHTGRTPHVDGGSTLLTGGRIIELPKQTPLEKLGDGAEMLLAALPYIGAFVGPILVYLAFVSSPRWLSSRILAWRVSLWTVLLAWLLTKALLMLYEPMPGLGNFMGNLLMQEGLGPLPAPGFYQYIRTQRELTDLWIAIWMAMTMLGAWLAVMIAWVIIGALGNIAGNLRRRRQAQHEWPVVLLLTLAALYAGCLLVLLFHVNAFFDRYLVFFVVPIVPLVAIQAGVPRPGNWRTAPAALLLLAYAAFAVAGTHDYLALNAARSRAYEAVLAGGVPPTHIDGGYEYNGWHLHDTPTYQGHLRAVNWYVDDDEYVISLTPRRGYETIHKYHVIHWLPSNHQDVQILHRLVVRIP